MQILWLKNIVPIRWYTYNGIVCIKYKGSRLIISPQQNTIKALNVDPSVWLGVIYYTVFLVLLRVELACVCVYVENWGFGQIVLFTENKMYF